MSDDTECVWGWDVDGWLAERNWRPIERRAKLAPERYIQQHWHVIAWRHYWGHGRQMAEHVRAYKEHRKRLKREKIKSLIERGPNAELQALWKRAQR
jgi:hypothetical protein